MIRWIRQWMNEQAFRRDVVETQSDQLARIQALEKYIASFITDIGKLQEQMNELIQQNNENVKHLRLLYSKAHDHDPKTEEITGNEVEGSEY